MRSLSLGTAIFTAVLASSAKAQYPTGDPGQSNTLCTQTSVSIRSDGGVNVTTASVPLAARLQAASITQTGATYSLQATLHDQISSIGTDRALVRFHLNNNRLLVVYLGGAYAPGQANAGQSLLINTVTSSVISQQTTSISSNQLSVSGLNLPTGTQLLQVTTSFESAQNPDFTTIYGPGSIGFHAGIATSLSFSNVAESLEIHIPFVGGGQIKGPRIDTGITPPPAVVKGPDINGDGIPDWDWHADFVIPDNDSDPTNNYIVDKGVIDNAPEGPGPEDQIYGVIGLDDNGNGVLDPSEIDDQVALCELWAGRNLTHWLKIDGVLYIVWENYSFYDQQEPHAPRDNRKISTFYYYNPVTGNLIVIEEGIVIWNGDADEYWENRYRPSGEPVGDLGSNRRAGEAI